jgi:hypothetical protein
MVTVLLVSRYQILIGVSLYSVLGVRLGVFNSGFGFCQSIHF